jgi:hypothetical protein
MKARHERGVRPVVSWDLEERSLAYGRVDVEGSRGDVGAHLVHKYQALGVDAACLQSP